MHLFFIFPLVREQDKCENFLILKDFFTLNRYSFKVCKRTHPALCKLYKRENKRVIFV